MNHANHHKGRLIRRRFRKVVMIPLVIVVSTFLPAFSAFGSQFVKAIGGSGDEAFYSSIKTSDGNIVMTGYTTSSTGGDTDVVIVKTDFCGQTLWKQRFGGDFQEEGKSVIETYDGGYVIAGYTNSFGGGGHELLLAKFDSGGNRLWTKVLTRPNAHLEFYGNCVIEDVDHNLVVAGLMVNHDVSRDRLFLAKFSSSGGRIAVRSYFHAMPLYDHYGYSLVQASNNTDYVVVGSVYHPTYNEELLVARFEEDLDPLYGRRYEGDDNLGGKAYSITRASDGGYLIVGKVGDDCCVFKLEGDLGPVWYKKGGSGSSEAYSATELAAGGFVVTGWTSAGSGNLLLARFDASASGNCTWSRGWGDNTGKETGYSVFECPERSLMATGSTTGWGTGGDCLEMKFDSSGHTCLQMYNLVTIDGWNPSSFGHDLIWWTPDNLEDLNWSPTVTPLALNTTVVCTSPEITITYPQTSDTVGCSPADTLRWTSTSTTFNPEVKIKTSTDGGGSWSPWLTVDNSGSRPWTSPCVSSDDCLVVIASLDECSADTSGVFSIRPCLCGDANGDGTVADISDLVFLVAYLFGGGATPGPCGDNPIGLGNADGCGIVTYSDLYSVYRHFACGGPDPVGCENTAPCSTVVRGVVSIGCPPYSVYPNSDSVAIPIYITTDFPLAVYSLGLALSSDSVLFSSIDWSGSQVVLTHGTLVREKQLLIAGHDANCSDAREYSDGLLCKMNVRIQGGNPLQPILFDSAFVPPGGEFFFVGADGQHYRPSWGCDCRPGDANGDGSIDISDVVYLIAYIFSGGSPPTPYKKFSGDANCDCSVDISDVVKLICFIFAGCSAPCTCEEWVSTSRCGWPLRK